MVSQRRGSLTSPPLTFVLRRGLSLLPRLCALLSRSRLQLRLSRYLPFRRGEGDRESRERLRVSDRRPREGDREYSECGVGERNSRDRDREVIVRKDQCCRETQEVVSSMISREGAPFQLEVACRCPTRLPGRSSLRLDARVDGALKAAQRLR